MGALSNCPSTFFFLLIKVMFISFLILILTRCVALSKKNCTFRIRREEEDVHHHEVVIIIHCSNIEDVLVLYRALSLS